MTPAKPAIPRFALGWAYAQAWVGKGASAIIYVALGYLLAPIEFGAFAVASTFVALAEMFVEQTIAQAVIQLPEAEQHKIGSLQFVALLLGGACTLGCLTMALVSYFMPGIEHKHMPIYALELSICPLLIAINAIPIGLLRRAMDYKTLARRTALATASGGAVGICVAALHGGGHALVALAVTYQFVSYLILRRGHAHLAINTSWQDVRSLRHLLIVNSQPKIADFLETKGLELVTAQFLGLPLAGALSYANKVAQTLFTFLAWPSLDAAWGQFANSRDDKRALFETYHRYQSLLTVTGLTMFCALAMASRQLIPLVLGSKWSVLNGLLPLLSLALVIRSALYLATILIQVIEPSVQASMVALLRAGLCLVITAVGGLFTQHGSMAVLGYALSGLIVILPTEVYLAKLNKDSARQLLHETVFSLVVFGTAWGAYTLLVNALHDKPGPFLDAILIALVAALVLLAAAWRHRPAIDMLMARLRAR